LSTLHGLTLLALFSAQLQRFPQALTICDTVPVSPGTPCAAEAAARGRFLRFCNITYAFCRNSGLQPFSQKSHTGVSNCSKRVPNRPLRPHRGRFGTLLEQLECGNFGRTAVGQVVRFRLVVVTTKSALVFFTPASAVTTSDWVVNIARSQRRSNKPCCT